MNERVLHFIQDLSWDATPDSVQHMLRRCILDLSATMIAGAETELSRIARDVSLSLFGGAEATLLLDGRRASIAGAALANGMTIDAMDMHDGYRPAKGHAGASVFPAALAVGEKVGWSGEQLALGMIVGYEIGLRAAVSLHQTACDYHTSGAWGALGAAAVTARALKLNKRQLRHALGIAEYHGPRSPMMRVIDAPTMLKDGSGWGSMAGVVAAQLAGAGFSGAPAATVESQALASIWDDLGQRWRILEIYFKPFACCRWAQPAVRAALMLTHRHQLKPHQINAIQVETFEAATRLRISRPRNTEEAQYNLPYALAAALIHGRLDPEQVIAPTLNQARILELAERVAMTVNPDLEARFPHEALARVRFEMQTGAVLESQVCSAPGDHHSPLSDSELDQKFTRLTRRRLPASRSKKLKQVSWDCPAPATLASLIALLAPPLAKEPNSDD